MTKTIDTPLQELSKEDIQLQLDNMITVDRFEEEESTTIRDPRTRRIKGDEKLIVNFSLESVYNKKKSVAEGHPIYDDVEMVSVQLYPDPKDPVKSHELLHVHTIATDYHIWKYPGDYEAFKTGLKLDDTGIPLSAWPVLKASQVKELNRLGVRTVEQLADMEFKASVFRPFAGFGPRAKMFLEECKKIEAEDKLKEQLATRDDEISDLRQQLEELKALVTSKKPKASEADK